MGRRSKRGDVVAAAATLIADHGLGSVSIRDVAKAAGVRAASVYRLFEDKDALFEEVLHYIIDDADFVRRRFLSSSATPEEKIKATVYYALYDSPVLEEHRKILQRALVDEDAATLEIFGKVQGEQMDLIMESLRAIPSVKDANFTFYTIVVLMMGYLDFQPLFRVRKMLPKLHTEPKFLTARILELAMPGVEWDKVRLLDAPLRTEKVMRERPAAKAEDAEPGPKPRRPKVA